MFVFDVSTWQFVLQGGEVLPSGPCVSRKFGGVLFEPTSPLPSLNPSISIWWEAFSSLPHRVCFYHSGEGRLDHTFFPQTGRSTSGAGELLACEFLGVLQQLHLQPGAFSICRRKARLRRSANSARNP